MLIPGQYYPQRKYLNFMKTSNYKKYWKYMWDGGETWAFWVPCLEAGGFQNEVWLWSERRWLSETAASFLADAILGRLLASDLELETAFKGRVTILRCCYTPGWTRISNKADLLNTRWALAGLQTSFCFWENKGSPCRTVDRGLPSGCSVFGPFVL